MAKTEEPVVDIDRYINRLKKFLQNQYLIKEPKRLESICFASHDRQGNTLGWAIMGQEIVLRHDNYLDVDEYGRRVSDNLAKITTFSYHFQPEQSSGLREWRIDFKDCDLHVNPDGGDNEHLDPDQVPLDIDNFNLYLTLILTILYTSKRIYPFEPEAEAVYQSSLNKGRRQISGAS
ncbi:hypothetical protein SY88_09620 [Clostridiales bacterium PH28_bin88]|nr:hypothetical protein SY88_09620 [Clostridiales bacterium PH28_bin88]